MPPTNRHPRTVDTSMTFCPHIDCDYRGWLGLNNLRANGHPSRGPWRQFQCPGCYGYFLETHGILFHGKQVAVELIVRVLACLAAGLGIRATARVFEVAPNTVLHGLVEAADEMVSLSALLPNRGRRLNFTQGLRQIVGGDVGKVQEFAVTPFKVIGKAWQVCLGPRAFGNFSRQLRIDLPQLQGALRHPHFQLIGGALKLTMLPSRVQSHRQWAIAIAAPDGNIAFEDVVSFDGVFKRVKGIPTCSSA